MNTDKAVQALADRLKADAMAIFNDPPSMTSQEVRDVIEWYDASLRAALTQRQQGGVPSNAGPAGEFGKHFGCSGPVVLTAAPPAQPQSEPPLQHCRGCGEGVTTFCRAPRHEGECLVGLPHPGRSAQPPERAAQQEGGVGNGPVERAAIGPSARTGG